MMAGFAPNPLIRLARCASHLLARGEKGADCELTAQFPSPLVGEGARRADEGDFLRIWHRQAQHPSPGFPLNAENHPLPQGARVGSATGVSL